MGIRNAAKALIIKDNRILLNKCQNSTGHTIDTIQLNEVYYDLPGGGQNQFETIEEAVSRECIEETGYNVIADRLGAIYEEIYMDNGLRRSYPNYVHKIYFIFVCHILDQDRKTVTEKDIDQIEAQWIDIKDMDNINLYPQALKDNLQLILSSKAPISLGSKRIY